MQKESGPMGRFFFVRLTEEPNQSNIKLLSNNLSRSLSRSLSCLLNRSSLFLSSSLFSNYLNRSLSLSLAALFVALVSACHCSKSNSYDKKHFFHTKSVF